MSNLGQKMIEERYVFGDEKNYIDIVDRMLSIFPEDQEERKIRLRQSMLNYDFIPATPNLTNLGTKERGLSISCFVSEFDDEIGHIIETSNHNKHLASGGGGIGTGISRIREIGAEIKNNGKTAGIFPFLGIIDADARGISQGGTRGGSTVVNLDIDHPEIEEFIKMRKAETGSDIYRKFPKLHHTISIPDEFMIAVLNDDTYNLISRVDGSVTKVVSAFDLFMDILEVRYGKGEPNLIFIDNVNNRKSSVYTISNSIVTMSNLCLEILLRTSPILTAVCDLGSLNLARFDIWKDDIHLIEDAMFFLDLSLQETVKQISEEKDDQKRRSLERVVNSIMDERSIGLGVMGYHTYLQSKNIPLESAIALSKTREIFSHIDAMATEANVRLGMELGACPLAARHGLPNRFANVTAIAPTASISHLAGGMSPGIDPIMNNYHSVGNEEGLNSWRNPNLDLVITKYALGKGLSEIWIEETWKSILLNEGSVQHLEWMEEWDKLVFKTAFELDMGWIVELAAIRQKFIDQSQSLNLFFPNDVDMKHVFNVHVKAWSLGVKTLYYCRGEANNRSNDASSSKTAKLASNFNNDYSECLACHSI